MIDVTIPVPPSSNALFRNVPGKGRVKTGDYKRWLNEAGWQLLAQKPAPITGRVNLTLDVQRSRGDVSNRVKAAEDLLVRHGLIEDDRLVQSITARWSDEVVGCRVMVEAA